MHDQAGQDVAVPEIGRLRHVAGRGLGDQMALLVVMIESLAYALRRGGSRHLAMANTEAC